MHALRRLAALCRGYTRAMSRAPETPTALPSGAWRQVAKRTWREFREDNATDWAAALTYYGIQSIFPALLVLLSIVGLAGRSATDSLQQNLREVAPGPAQSIVTNAIANLQNSQGAAGVLLIFGILAALWSASGYVGAFTRASNAIWEVEEGRPFLKLRPQQLAITAAMLLLLSVSAIAVVLTGGLAQQAGNVIGVGNSAVQVWDIAKWPVLLGVVTVMLALLYWAAPNAQQEGFRWITPGGLVGVLVWLIASAAFALYVANFSNYNKTYGSLGAVIAFLVWLWISNLAVLFGAEVNAELARQRRMAEGQPEDHEPIAPPRDTQAMKHPPQQARS